VTDSDSILGELERLIRDVAEDTIIWTQNGGELMGKYFYVPYDKRQIGVFIGFFVDGSGKIRTCITFFFAHPTVDLSETETSETNLLFHRILIKANLELKRNPYKIVKGRGFPAVFRTLHVGEENHNIQDLSSFFKESMGAVIRYETLLSERPAYM
jgi:hypothetical protein